MGLFPRLPMKVSSGTSFMQPDRQPATVPQAWGGVATGKRTCVLCKVLLHDNDDLRRVPTAPVILTCLI